MVPVFYGERCSVTKMSTLSPGPQSLLREAFPNRAADGCPRGPGSLGFGTRASPSNRWLFSYGSGGQQRWPYGSAPVLGQFYWVRPGNWKPSGIGRRVSALHSQGPARGKASRPCWSTAACHSPCNFPPGERACFLHTQKDPSLGWDSSVLALPLTQKDILHRTETIPRSYTREMKLASSKPL